MIPGVLAQTLKRPPPPTHVNISLATRQQASAAINLGLAKTFAVQSGGALAFSRSKALPKAIASRVGQALVLAPHLNKILIPRIGQAVSYFRRIGQAVRILQTQRVLAPQVQPGNLRATQTTLQVLEVTSDPTNLRATQVTIQVLRTQA
jgi:hypothetical protein